MATVRLADTLEDMAEAAGRGPEAAKSVARALRWGAGNAFWGQALLAAADSIKAADQRVQEAGSDRSSPGAFAPKIVMPGAELLDQTKTADLACDFPDLATAYERGRECGPECDEGKRKAHEGYAKRYRKRGWVPCEPRKLKAPDDQWWAVNYLRHKCSDYEKIYRRLRGEVWKLPIRGRGALEELMHQTVKNRVQDEIAKEFPELAEAAMEQKV